MKFSSKVCERLDLDRFKKELADRCRSPLGEQVASNLKPCIDSDEVRSVQRYVRALLDVDRIDPLPWRTIEPLSPLIADAKTAGFFNEAELLELRHVLVLAAALREKLIYHRDKAPDLSVFIDGLRDFTAEIEALQVIDDDGFFADTASSSLALLRENLARARRDGKSKLTHLLTGSLGQKCADRQPYFRNGRFLVLLKAGAAGQVPGKIVERQGTTVYFEPEDLFSVNRKLGQLQSAVDEEVHRLCVQLSQPLLARQKALRVTEETLGYIDFYSSLASRVDRGWNFPQMVKKQLFDFLGLRHPLLGDAAVPINVHCGKNFKQLIITGPNTGGKTVVLKTVALGLWLSWCGLPAPCSSRSQVGTFDALYLDIGDEQSLEQNLSTFSGHIVNVSHMLERVTDCSVVLLDELGAGTDPREGAALGVALLQELASRGCLTLATTHHNGVKNYAATTPEVEAASVDFDEKTLRPTYKLLIGIPGSSNALHIAKRYGMPQRVLDLAWKVLQGQEQQAEELMSSLHRRASLLERQARQQESRHEELKTLEQKLRAKQQRLEERKDKLMIDAERKAQSVVLEAEEQAKALLRDLRGVDLAEGHRRLKGHKQTNQSILERARITDNALTAKAAARQNDRPIAVGDWVRGGGVVGEVIELKGKRAYVQAGGLTVEVAAAKLSLEKRPKEKNTAVKVTYAGAAEAGSSLMVRGSTVDEALPTVGAFLDRAFHAGYGEVTLIHGRGEGILRRAIHQLLNKTPYVSSYRLGEMGEGGYGVTIVCFK